MLRARLLQAAAVAALALAALLPAVAGEATAAGDDTRVTATTAWETAPVGKFTTAWE
ncbi:hypothetical protein [Streptomyces sp. RerS4]|uniref:hypothetical protein n=1 Tax=Streptomyces sp. RerS4 TaxID=2942449 RepID=UPI00201BC185|nr:hypothetical protein [Streptomyces sp. RerS4]UQX02336.1 hypothetical protein M4D82_18955 [Streptomyces sp. RerS4]